MDKSALATPAPPTTPVSRAPLTRTVPKARFKLIPPGNVIDAARLFEHFREVPTTGAKLCAQRGAISAARKQKMRRMVYFVSLIPGLRCKVQRVKCHRCTQQHNSQQQTFFAFWLSFSIPGRSPTYQMIVRAPRFSTPSPVAGVLLHRAG